MRSRSEIGATVEQLRADIDHGRTGDKVAGSDPAAAPLGADEEAAGTPVSPHQAAAARLQETSTQRANDPASRSGTWVALSIFILLAFAGVLAALLAL